MKLKRILFLPSFLTVLFLWGFFITPVAAQSDIIQQVIENGGLSSLPKPNQGLGAKLFCQGAVPCGSVVYTNIVRDPASSTNKIRFTATVQITMGVSRLTVHNAFFIANSLAAFGAGPLDPNSGNTPFAVFMLKHDPINPGDGTGRFADATNLHYRGMVEFHDLNSFFVESRQSAYVISKGN